MTKNATFIDRQAAITFWNYTACYQFAVGGTQEDVVENPTPFTASLRVLNVPTYINSQVPRHSKEVATFLRHLADTLDPQ